MELSGRKCVSLQPKLRHRCDLRLGEKLLFPDLMTKRVSFYDDALRCALASLTVIDLNLLRLVP